MDTSTQALASATHDARYLYNAMVQHSNMPETLIERAAKLSATLDGLYDEACRKELAERTRQVLDTIEGDNPPTLFTVIARIREILDSFEPF